MSCVSAVFVNNNFQLQHTPPFGTADGKPPFTANWKPTTTTATAAVTSEARSAASRRPAGPLARSSAFEPRMPSSVRWPQFAQAAPSLRPPLLSSAAPIPNGSHAECKGFKHKPAITVYASPSNVPASSPGSPQPVVVSVNKLARATGCAAMPSVAFCRRMDSEATRS